MRLTEQGVNGQCVGYAVSSDLYVWDKAPGPVLEADVRWYEKLSDGHWHDEAFRYPWVFADPVGHGWHMRITARANHGDPVDRGVVGHAWSADLEVLLFNCLVGDMPEAARAEGLAGGVWVADAKSPLGPYDIAGAQVIDDPSLCVGKFVTERGSGDTRFLAFVHDRDGAFVGEITDPYAVSLDSGRPVVMLDRMKPRWTTATSIKLSRIFDSAGKARALPLGWSL